MYSLRVGFVLLVLLIVFIWICFAGYFKYIGKVTSKFAEPFKEEE